MAIPSRQIGWGTQANLLWQISKQLERLICVAACECPTTTTTTSTVAPITTTTTTTAALVFTNTTFVNCEAPCSVACAYPQLYFDIWMSQDCIDNWPQVGCQVFLDIEGSIGGPFPTGTYNTGEGLCINIEDGVIV